MKDAPNVKIKLDVRYDDKSCTAHAKSPGMKKKDIHVVMDGSPFSIRPDVKNVRFA